MVLDLKGIREERIFKDTIQFVLDNPEACLLVDQDALSVVLQGRWQVMDWRWNVLHFCVERMPKPYYIRHITGNKPWAPSKFGIERAILKQWHDDLAESPWPHKFAANQDGFLRTYVRPITTAIERPIKLWANAEADNVHGRLARYLEALPGTLASIDKMSANRELARNLW